MFFWTTRFVSCSGKWIFITGLAKQMPSSITKHGRSWAHGYQCYFGSCNIHFCSHIWIIASSFELGKRASVEKIEEVNKAHISPFLIPVWGVLHIKKGQEFNHIVKLTHAAIFLHLYKIPLVGNMELLDILILNQLFLCYIFSWKLKSYWKHPSYIFQLLAGLYVVPSNTGIWFT